MFKQGLTHGAYVFSIMLISLAVSFLINNEDVAELISVTSLIVSFLLTGYFFKKHYGSVISNLTDAQRAKGFYQYLFAVGLIWGPLKLVGSGFPISDINPIINIILLLVSIPLAGLSLIGPLIVGGMFYRVKT